MRTTQLLARRGLRKQRLQVIAVSILTVLAAALINLGAVSAFDFPRSLDERFEELRTPDFELLLLDGDSVEVARDTLADDDRVASLQVQEAPVMLGTFRYGDDDQTSLMTILEMAEQQGEALSGYSIVDSAETDYPDGAYVPTQWHTGGGYELGDALTIEVLGAEYEFTVQGFFESPSLGSITLGTVGVLLPTDAYAAFLEEHEPALGGLISVETVDPADADAVLAGAAEAVLTQNASAEADSSQAETSMSFNGTTRDTMRMAATVGSGITAAILIAFAVILAGVTALVLRYLCRNTIERDLEAIGTMKAIGVGVPQLRASYLMVFAGTGLIAAVLGVAASYLFMPLVETMLGSQAGMTWTVGFDWVGLILAVVVLVGTLLMSTLLATRRVGRIAPVAALRSGIPNHTFTRNPLPLATSRSPLLATLGFKQLLHKPGQVISITVIVALVTFASMFALGAVKNIAGDPIGFTHLLVGDYEDLSVYPAEGFQADDELAEEYAQLEGVRKAFPKATATATSDGTQYFVTVTEDFDRLDISSLIEGRYPRHDNEIAIGAKVSEVLDAGIGDTIPVTLNSGTAEYLITGLTQSSRSLGMEGSITTAGAQRIDPAFAMSTIAVYLEEGTETGPVIDAIEGQLANETLEVIDLRANVTGQLVTYVTMASGLSTTILAITFAVVVTILSLMVSTLLVEQRRDFGVRRALGYTWLQLATQTALAYTPVVAAGGVLGALAGYGFLDSLVSGMLGTTGLTQASLPVDASWALALVVALVVVAFVLVFALSSRIRKISPVTQVRA